MNKASYDLLSYLITHPNATQRELSLSCGFSLGKVNKELKILSSEGYLDKDHSITDKTRLEMKEGKPSNGVILAAGYGFRMIPLHLNTHKGLLKINGESLVERSIRQMKEAGIRDIYIVVGHLKEDYEFLMDDEEVHLLVNPEYLSKNNLHSLYCALPYMGNSYIVPCDLYFEENPFSSCEFYSWYGMSTAEKNGSGVRINAKGEIEKVRGVETGNRMVGISYLLNSDMEWFRPRIKQLVKDSSYDHAFWEEALMGSTKMRVWSKSFSETAVYEFTSLKDLEPWQEKQEDFDNPSLKIIKSVLNVSPSEIKDIQPLDGGMTNHSFIFRVEEKWYVMRVPGEGTGLLINRQQEKEVYEVLKSSGLASELVYIDPESGFKLSKKLDDVRVCDPYSEEDLQRCVEMLRRFHQRELQVKHEFNLFEKIEYYENLWGGVASIYRDYKRTKSNVFALKEYIEDHVGPFSLCHVDSVHDNFLFYRDEDKTEEALVMIDWEYAAMQDPHIDLAMFAIYANYNQHELDGLIDLYFRGDCPEEIRTKIYAYVAACGLLWSNWCEYKQLLGIDFGQYALNQYRYAKVYYNKTVESEAYKMWKENRGV